MSLNAIEAVKDDYSDKNILVMLMSELEYTVERGFGGIYSGQFIVKKEKPGGKTAYFSARTQNGKVSFTMRNRLSYSFDLSDPNVIEEIKDVLSNPLLWLSSDKSFYEPIVYKGVDR